MPDGHCPGMLQVTAVDDQFGTHRVEPQLGAEQGKLVAFQVADRHSAPAVGGADHGGEHEFERGFFVRESRDDLGASAFFDEAALG